MLEDTTLNCPICDTEIHVKVMQSGKKAIYIVSSDCPNCASKPSKIERLLNYSGKGRVKLERSYIKLDPRG